VNPQTFAVYYHDEELYKVYVAGRVEPISEVEFRFVPDEALRDGIRYFVQVFGEEEAIAQNRDQWVKDLAGGPLQKGRLWSFWTMPDLQVRIVPVQVLEGVPLVHYKPTVLRTFIHWDAKPDVFWKGQVSRVEVDDVVVSWWPPAGEWGDSNWRDEPA
jgi:hypothetical protein